MPDIYELGPLARPQNSPGCLQASAIRLIFFRINLLNIVTPALFGCRRIALEAIKVLPDPALQVLTGRVSPEESNRVPLHKL